MTDCEDEFAAEFYANNFFETLERREECSDGLGSEGEGNEATGNLRKNGTQSEDRSILEKVNSKNKKKTKKTENIFSDSECFCGCFY